MKNIWILAGVVVLGCEGERPTATSPELSMATGLDSEPSSLVVTSQSAIKEGTISGTVQFAGAAPPGRSVLTPSEICHFWDSPVFTSFDGDVEGAVTFHEQTHGRCDFSHLTGSGPFDGQVQWNGRSGSIAGQWTTNCKADSSQPIGLSCDGTMNARGSGGLEGVQFHFKWGPGWYPFTYTGTAFSR